MPDRVRLLVEVEEPVLTGEEALILTGDARFRSVFRVVEADSGFQTGERFVLGYHSPTLLFWGAPQPGMLWCLEFGFSEVFTVSASPPSESNAVLQYSNCLAGMMEDWTAGGWACGEVVDPGVPKRKKERRAYCATLLPEEFR